MRIYNSVNQYPAFSAWVRGPLRHVFEDEVLARLFRQRIPATAAEPASYVGGGYMSPALDLGDLGWLMAMFQLQNPLRIVLDRRIAASFRYGSTPAYIRVIATAKILHELIHLAREDDHFDSDNDAGAAFEIDAYGAHLSWDHFSGAPIPRPRLPGLTPATVLGSA
jgi:hypothetical protein